MKKIFKSLSGLITAIVLIQSLQSCYTYQQFPTGENVHQEAIGKNENEILRMYGVPDKKESDGAGGSIFIYEKLFYNTTTGGGSYSQGNVYGTPYGVGANNGSIYSGRNSSTIDKQYLNLYFNKKGIVYDYKSNWGDKYRTEKVRDKNGTLWAVLGGVGLLSLALPAIILLTSGY